MRRFPPAGILATLPRLSVVILIHNVYGVGGTNRAILNLASALASTRCDVEIVSVFRRVDVPTWQVDPRVRLTPLVDTRPGSPDRDDDRQWQRSSIVPPHEEYFTVYSELTDDRLKGFLESSTHDVIIGTRPALNLAIATWAPERAIRIAQEHQTHLTLPAGVREAMRTRYARMDAAVTVTEADAQAFRVNTQVPGLRIEAIPNSVPRPPLRPSTLTNHLVIAAGRLDPVKRYDVLIKAFAQVHERADDWRLRIYGAGGELSALRNLISDLGLDDVVLMMGRRGDLVSEWPKASIAVSTSDRESFGMSIVEAMRAGLPVVSTRAPVGPAEIIDDSVNGYLVNVGDIDAVASKLLDLIDDRSTRRRFGDAALSSGARYEPGAIAKRYRQLILDLADARPVGSGHGQGVRWIFSRATKSRRSMRAISGRQGAPYSDLAIQAITQASGGLVVRVVGAIAQESRLRLESREGGQAVSLRLYPDGSTGSKACEVASDLLDEGRWNVYLESAGPPRRLLFGVADTRASLGRADPDSGPLHRLLPYETQDGYLAIRSWQRTLHAECESIRTDDEWLVFRGRLHGDLQFDPVASFFGQRQGAKKARVDGTIMEGEGGGTFEARLSVDRLGNERVSRHDDWDLFIGTSSGRSIRLARLLDDIAERRSVYQYQAVECRFGVGFELVEEWPNPTVRARPFVTVNSDVCVSVLER